MSIYTLNISAPSVASILQFDHTCSLLTVYINVSNMSRGKGVSEELADLLEGLALRSKA